MGARQSKRSVDITSSPSKTNEGESIAEGEGRLVKIGDVDVKTATNGTVPHTEVDVEVTEKDENAKDITVEKSIESKENPAEVAESKEVKENGVSDSEELKTPDSDTAGENLNESGVSEKSPESTEVKEGEATPETKKLKEKKKKKWSFRSLSFSKKDKSKSKDGEKNGEVKEIAEENAEDAKSPSSESPKTENAEPQAEAAPVLNGEASKEEIAESPSAVSTEETKSEESKKEENKPEESKEEVKIEETKIEETKNTETVESVPIESISVKTPVEETKEVRNEEVPPPLPSSNPPSSLTAFAESTKADILNTQTIDLLETSAPVNTSLKETENLKITDEANNAPVLEYADSEKSIADLLDLPLSQQPKSELGPSLTKSDNSPEVKSEIKETPIKTETVVLQSQVLDPVSDISLLESEKRDNKPADHSLIQEIISVVSTETSDNSIPLGIEVPLPEQSTIELSLKPLPRNETEQNADPKDLQSKTDLNETLPNTDSSDAQNPSIEVKKIPENIAFFVEENPVDSNDSELICRESFASDFNQKPKPSEGDFNTVTSAGPQVATVELVFEDAKPRNIQQPESNQSLNLSEESESIDSLPPPQLNDLPIDFAEESKSELPPAPSNANNLEEAPADLPSPTDLPPPSAGLADQAESLQDISTESLPSLPEPISENFTEPISLPPVDSVPEPIATDLPSDSANNKAPSASDAVPVVAATEPIETKPEAAETSPNETVQSTDQSVPPAIEPASLPTEPVLLATEIISLATDNVASDSNPHPPTEPPVLTNGNVNGLLSPGEVSPTTNGSSNLLGEAAPLKQVPQELPCEAVKEEGDKTSAAAEVAAVEE
ncbi:unnamed protein product [Phyllotreta striolata]|uniref:Uncharacterized protein n=1 Tax=Phyllotreta striolata TaxID=444603 RepID=A0A9N9TTU8_PHYSR|nr:unnamed protein product [Phyllotreta striolata]